MSESIWPQSDAVFDFKFSLIFEQYNLYRNRLTKKDCKINIYTKQMLYH